VSIHTNSDPYGGADAGLQSHPYGACGIIPNPDRDADSDQLAHSHADRHMHADSLSHR